VSTNIRRLAVPFGVRRAFTKRANLRQHRPEYYEDPYLHDARLLDLVSRISPRVAPTICSACYGASRTSPT